MCPYSTTDDTLIIAFDIGKNVHWLGCYDGRLNELIAPHKLRSDILVGSQMSALSACFDSHLHAPPTGRRVVSVG